MIAWAPRSGDFQVASERSPASVSREREKDVEILRMQKKRKQSTRSTRQKPTTNELEASPGKDVGGAAPRAAEVPRQPDFDPRLVDPNGVGNIFHAVSASLQALTYMLDENPNMPPSDYARWCASTRLSALRALCCITGERHYWVQGDEWKLEQVAPPLAERFAEGLRKPLAEESMAHLCARTVLNWSMFTAGTRYMPDGSSVEKPASYPSEDVYAAANELFKIGQLFQLMPDAADILRAGSQRWVNGASATVSAAVDEVLLPFKFNNTHDAILGLLAKTQRRMKTAEIASALLLEDTSIGHELVQLVKAQLVSNIKRKGYMVEPRGLARARDLSL